MNNEEIMVSICCMTYNQEKYIKQALDSFLMQKTNFKFEIIIHDDCSTDNTTNIIKEYAEKYPDIVVPIYESENQYSKGIDVCTPCWNKSKGKYIALCEGDDFWCNENKLQIQFDFMEQNVDYSLVTTNSYICVDDKIKKRKKTISKNTDISIQDILKYEFIFTTNSMFFRRKFLKDLPQYYYECSIGDRPLIIYLSLCGKVYYIKDRMSVYRFNAAGSWSSKQIEGNITNIIKKKEKINNDIEKLYIQINHITNFKYNDIIQIYLLNRDIDLKILKNDLSSLKDKKYKKLYKKYDLRGKIKLFLVRNLPKIYLKIKGDNG